MNIRSNPRLSIRRRSTAAALAAVLACTALHSGSLPAIAQADEPGEPSEAALRVHIRASEKSHGPADNRLHDYPRFLEDWTELLAGRGMEVTGGLEFPAAEQLEQTDVLIVYAASGGNLEPAHREALAEFQQRGGGLVMLHDAVVSDDPEWLLETIGGAWEHGMAQWHDGEVDIYFTPDATDHPITRDASNFAWDDEIYTHLHIHPDAGILAVSFHDVFTIAPQMWTFERDDARTFVSLAGHQYDVFETDHFRALLLRAIAWTAGLDDVDQFCTEAELAALPYPPGGPLHPSVAADQVRWPDEFEGAVIAAEPLIAKAIAIDWDTDGQLWVAETPEYPHGRTEPDTRTMVDLSLLPPDQRHNVEVEPEPRRGRDRISLLRDTTGDGLMDEKHVFADDLELITGLVFHRDGVIVSQAPEILFLRDTTGDGVADTRETLYTGLGTFDSHAVINNLRWGLDGWIYGSLGYSGADVRSGVDDRALGRFGSGVVRFRPDGSAFEQYTSEGGNKWGLGFNREGELFFTHPTSGNPILHSVLPERILARGAMPGTAGFNVVNRYRESRTLIEYDRQPYVQIDVVGGFTAAAGGAFQDSGLWPEAWEDTWYFGEPTINIVHQSKITRAADAPSFDGHRLPGFEDKEFMMGEDMWFRPVDNRIGPDGALYVVDFYNQAVAHNDTRRPPHGPRNAALRPDRDQYFGRIYRLQHREATAVDTTAVEAGQAGWVDALHHPTRTVRMHGHRLLLEHHDALEHGTVGTLQELAADEAADTSARIHALWVLCQAEAGSADLLADLLAADGTALAVNAARALVETAAAPLAADPGVRRALVANLGHDDPLARMWAAVALDPAIAAANGNPADPDEATPDKAAAMVGAFVDSPDRWTRSALLGTSLAMPAPVLAAAIGAGGDTLAADGMEVWLAALAERLAEQQDHAAVTAAIAGVAALEGERLPPAARAVIDTVARQWPGDAVMPWTDDLSAALERLLSHPDQAVVATATTLTAGWDSHGALAGVAGAAAGRLLEAYAHPDTAPEGRLAALDALLRQQPLVEGLWPATHVILGAHDGPDNDLAPAVIERLAGRADADTGTLLLTAFEDNVPRTGAEAFETLLRRGEWVGLLLDRLEEGDIEPGGFTPVQAHALLHHPDEAIQERARGMDDMIRGGAAANKAALVAEALPHMDGPADIARGRELFAASCSMCHQVGDVGRRMGPDISGMGRHDHETLLTAILDPNAEVEPTYLSWVVRLRDGQTHVGMIARENERVVVVHNAAGEFELRQSDVVERINTGFSAMPEGFEALGHDGLRDLLAFMRHEAERAAAD